MTVEVAGAVLLLGGVWLLVFGWRVRREASDGPPIGVPMGASALWSSPALLVGALLTIVGALLMVLAAP